MWLRRFPLAALEVRRLGTAMERLSFFGEAPLWEIAHLLKTRRRADFIWLDGGDVYLPLVYSPRLEEPGAKYLFAGEGIHLNYWGALHIGGDGGE